MCCRVSSCLCIGDLRVATLVIAVVSLLGNVGLLALTAWRIEVARLGLLLIFDTGKHLEFVSSFRAAIALRVVMLLISIAAIGLDVALFFGALTFRQDMVQYWSRGHAVVSGAYLVCFSVLFLGLFAEGYIGYGFLVLIPTMLGTAVTVYFWIVVRSFDLKLNRANVSTVSGSCAPSRTYNFPPA